MSHIFGSASSSKRSTRPRRGVNESLFLDSTPKVVETGLVNECWATSLGSGEKKPESIRERGSQGTVIRASSSPGEFISSLVSPFLGVCQRLLYSKSRVIREGSFGKEERS